MGRITLLTELIDVGHIYSLTVAGSKCCQTIYVGDNDVENYDYLLQIVCVPKPKKESEPAMPGGMGV